MTASWQLTGQGARVGSVSPQGETKKSNASSTSGAKKGDGAYVVDIVKETDFNEIHEAELAAELVEEPSQSGTAKKGDTWSYDHENNASGTT